MPSEYDVFAALLRAFEAADAGAALGLCTHDVVFEFPFLHVAFGRSDFTPVVDTMSRLQGLQFTDLRIEPLAAAGAYLATYSGTATVSATGRSYNQCYINRFEIEDGLVKRFAEHFDTAVYRGAFARSAG